MHVWIYTLLISKEFTQHTLALLMRHLDKNSDKQQQCKECQRRY